MTRRCLICANINPCRDHSEYAQDAELGRNMREIAAIEAREAASRIEAQRGETPKSGSISEADESLTAESGDAHTQSPRECK